MMNNKMGEIRVKKSPSLKDRVIINGEIVENHPYYRVYLDGEIVKCCVGFDDMSAMVTSMLLRS